MTKQRTTKQGRGTPAKVTGTGSRWRWLWIPLAAVALTVGVVYALGGPQNPNEQGFVVEVQSGGGAPAPDIALPNFEGEIVRLTDFRDKGLVVNYWASWCLPCLAEMPGFEAVYQENRDTVAFLGVNLVDDRESALKVVADTGITYPLAVDQTGESYAAFGASSMPTTVFVSPDGEVLELIGGPLSAAQLEAKVNEFFGS